MNNTFNLQRFGLLLKRQWLEFGKIYLISLVVVIGVITAFYGLNVFPLDRINIYNPLSFREPLFALFGFLFITVVASNYFAHMGQKSRATLDIMLPASTFEKFLSGLLYGGVLSIFSYLVIFYLLDMAFVNYIKANVNQKIELTGIFNKDSFEKMLEFKFTYLFPFLITSIFLLGSIYFNRFHYIKTAITVMVFIGLWSFIIYKSGRFLFDNRTMIETSDSGSRFADKATGDWMALLLIGVITLIFWAITYIRLKEKEV